MQKYNSFEDIVCGLQNEEISYPEGEDKTIAYINNKRNIRGLRLKRTMSICAVFTMIFIVTSMSYATNLLGIRTAINDLTNEIQCVLLDNDGNEIMNIGALNWDSSQEEEFKCQQELFDKIEKQVPNDKIALVIPIQNNGKMKMSYLNMSETVYSMNKLESSNYPVKFGFIPENFKFKSAEIIYSVTNAFDKTEYATFVENIEHKYNEAKEAGKEYYYEEFERGDEIDNIDICFGNKNKTLQVFINRGLSGWFTNGNKDKESLEKYEKGVYKGTNYVADENMVYTYKYIDGELYSIKVSNDNNVSIEEIMDMVQSLDMY